MNKLQKTKLKQQKEEKKQKRKNNYVLKTYYGYGRIFKRCENCEHATSTMGACKGKIKIYCKYREVFMNKKAELLCFNVQKAQNYLNIDSGKILYC